MYHYPSWTRRGSTIGSLLVIIIFVFIGFLFIGILFDDEDSDYGYICDDNGVCEFYEEQETDWYDLDEDYDEDDDVWDTWEIKDKSRTSKSSRQHGKYGDGVFKSEDELRAFISTTAGDINSVWDELFKEYRKIYRKPKVKIFSDEVDTACGSASSEDGPFYCGADESVYLDLNFFANMSESIETESSGKFAISYVIAHEFGHHIQNLIGDADKYDRREQRLRERGNENKANLVSVQTELQADFYAGVWASWYDEKTDALTEDDIMSALTTAMAVGDDALGENRRENFGHGSSEMRARWLIRGMVTGDVKYGNTYDYKSLSKLEEVDMMLDDEEEEGHSKKSIKSRDSKSKKKRRR